MKIAQLFCFLLLSFLHFQVQAAQDTTDIKKVYVLEIRDNIDPRMNRKVKMALEDAVNKEVDYILIHMDTYGGAVNDADDIRTMLLEAETPTISFIDKDAASAGALISIACDSIYMAPGASIGAATVVMGGSGEAAPDKYQSYMRSMMRSTAEAKGRDPKIAEAMVDEKLVIEGITTEGSVITFSVSEAIKNGFCEAEVHTIDEAIQHLGIDNHELIEYEAGVAEHIISIFLNPAISGFLILIIIGGIYFEIQTPGVGFPLAAAVTAVILYFIPYYLTGLAENWEIVVFILGIILLALELFVIPGFGVAGILGIACILTGLTLGMLPNDAFDFSFVPSEELFVALVTVILATVIAIGGIFMLAPKVNEWQAFSKITLATTQKKEDGYTSFWYSNDLLEKEGIAHTRLMPSGKVLVDEEIYDAHSRGEFIGQGEKIKVISTEGTSLKVKKIS
ncbi:nodulation protein NfeD [Echinicola strongylocentroti]|uniref:Nodulation protein NfeD n=1 Tax=Echinicola strongylocentroti TaxID=1795355 RepID=A0A2Z4ILM9_9BACT|nr:NfeD family protein [Echinicola strongylocentroti]AWW31630.1 nodulation protein NfeD [Echinicola strongylocentroti]